MYNTPWHAFTLRLTTAFIAGILAIAGFTGPAASAAPTETLQVTGLKAPAEILVDRWGVPHIYAASEADVFFVQGFNASRDRLFQIDLWRRRGLGQLAEVFRQAFVEQDKASRLFLYQDDMDREWRAYSSRGTGEAKDITLRFVACINAYVDWLAGQSGDPDSPHYRDLAPMWRDGTYFPLLYSRKAIEQVTEQIIRLVPEQKK